MADRNDPWAEFDPKKPEENDPWAAFDAQKPWHPVQGTMQAAVQGIPVAGGFANKAYAAIDAAMEPIFSKNAKISHAPTWSQRYNENLGTLNAQTQNFQQQYPNSSTAGRVAGGIAGTLPVLAAPFSVPGVIGRVARELPIRTTMATAGALGGTDTLARGGTAEEAARDAAISAGASLAGNVVGSVIGKTASGLAPKMRLGNDPITGRWGWQQVSQPSEGAIHAAGTGIGGAIGTALGYPEAGAFIGYGTSPALKSLVSRPLPDMLNWMVPKPLQKWPVSALVERYAPGTAKTPELQSVIQALKGEALNSKKGLDTD